MTNAERIRKMCDEELAAWATVLISRALNEMQKTLGIEPRYELDKLQNAKQMLCWLRQEADAERRGE